MFFGKFLDGFMSQVASCMGGLIKQGTLYTIYFIIIIITTSQQCASMKLFVMRKECLPPAIYQIVFISSQRTANRHQSFMFSYDFASLFRHSPSFFI